VSFSVQSCDYRDTVARQAPSGVGVTVKDKIRIYTIRLDSFDMTGTTRVQ
jgi:hypothetical protein